MSLSELPFHSENLEEFIPDINELLMGGHYTSKVATDGILDIHSVRFASANAKETARFMEYAFGLQEIAYKGLETGSTFLASHVVRTGNVVFEIVNSLGQANGYTNGNTKSGIMDEEEYAIITSDFVHRHGLGVLDVAISVVNAEESFAKAVKAGALVVSEPMVVSDDSGSIKTATVRVPDTDLMHTLVENINYTGVFMPYYQKSELVVKPGNNVGLRCVDHCVQNHTWNLMMPYARFYAAAFGLHKFWSVDDKDVYTGATALRSIVMASANGKVKLPINEPAKGQMKSQIEEFYDFYNGPGIQHIALRTTDILATVTELRHRGVEFNTIADTYYENLENRLSADSIELYEDFDLLKKNHILVDFDPESRFKTTRGIYRCNYILQIFTKPLHDRPTLFFEIIQRRHHNGFGKGTFKGLFETIELQQKLRGTLVPSDKH